VSARSSERYEAHTAIEVLCSEVAHEMAPTLTFLRDLVRSKVLDEIDHSIAEEEVARLAAILAALRRTKSHGEEAVAPVDVAAVAARAAARVGDEAPGRPAVALEIPRGLRVVASERGLELLLVALLRNAVSAAQHAPARLYARLAGDAWCLEVEDDGPGLPRPLDETLFVPLATLGAAGHGTGMLTVLRVARDHGWEISHARREDRTVFTVRISIGDTSSTGQS
jgi:C4-dicarboxylate-specific signal transduction histidine kinase